MNPVEIILELRGKHLSVTTNSVNVLFKFFNKKQTNIYNYRFVLSLISIKEGKNQWSEEWTEQVMKQQF